MLHRTAIRFICAIVLLGLFAQPLLMDGLKFNFHHSSGQKAYKTPKQVSFLFDENEEDQEDADDHDFPVATDLTTVFASVLHLVPKEQALTDSYNTQPYLYQSRSLWLINETLIR